MRKNNWYHNLKKNNPKKFAEYAAKARAYSSAKNKEYRQDPFHKDLDAILDHFDPDTKRGTINAKTYFGPAGYEFAVYKGKTYYVHQLVWMAANNSFVPKGKEINHKDLDKKNNKASNLEIVTRKQNIDHAIEKMGTFRPRVLTDEQRKERARERTRAWMKSLTPEQLEAFKERQRQAALRWYYKNRSVK